MRVLFRRVGKEKLIIKKREWDDDERETTETRNMREGGRGTEGREREGVGGREREGGTKWGGRASESESESAGEGESESKG